MKKLSELKVGEEAVIAEMMTENRRLKDMGLVVGTKTKCLLKSPLGDPAAYRVRGAVVAIRNDDACKIGIEVLCDD
jgi:ferrous iron transport protein A